MNDDKKPISINNQIPSSADIINKTDSITGRELDITIEKTQIDRDQDKKDNNQPKHYGFQKVF